MNRQLAHQLTVRTIIVQDMAEVAHACRSATAAFEGFGQAYRRLVERSMDEEAVEGEMASFKPYVL